MTKKTNKFIAPIVIAGVTVGFLTAAYKFVFAQPKKDQQNKDQNKSEKSAENEPTP